MHPRECIGVFLECSGPVPLAGPMPSLPHAWSIQPRVSSVLGAIGTLTAVVLFLSPVPMFQRIRKAHDTLGFSGTPYLVANVQCFAWVIYCALVPGRQAPLATNAIGIGFETTYCALYLYHAHGDVRTAYARLLAFSAAGCLAFLALVFAVAAPQRPQFVGYVAIVLNIASYSSPLGIMGTVIRTKSVACMPLPLSVATLACALAWTVFAIYVADATIVVPNSIGVGLALCQIVLFALYASTPQSKADAAEAAKLRAERNAVDGGAELHREHLDGDVPRATLLADCDGGARTRAVS